MKIYSHALGLRMRRGNFKHLTRYESHCDLLKPELMTFIQTYMDHSSFSELQQSKFKEKVLKLFEKR